MRRYVVALAVAVLSSCALAAMQPREAASGSCRELAKLTLSNATITRAEDDEASASCRVAGGGEGPNTFDTVAALEHWVEQGGAPDQIVALHATSGHVDRTRPLCPYPQAATYKGSGSADEAVNFVCSMGP